MANLGFRFAEPWLPKIILKSVLISIIIQRCAHHFCENGAV